jgi:hypothetical protein
MIPPAKTTASHVVGEVASSSFLGVGWSRSGRAGTENRSPVEGLEPYPFCVGTGVEAAWARGV